jgi:hypothetical protein
MGKFSPTTLKGDCEEIANPSTANGRRRHNWIDAHGTVALNQVFNTSRGNPTLSSIDPFFLAKQP